MLKCAIIQPNFLPWRGMFHILKRVDKFIVYDDVLFTKHSWRNRNRIKTKNKTQWLTVPVLTKGYHDQHIKDAKIDNKQRWSKKLISTITQAYGKAQHFDLSVEILSILSKQYDYILDLDMDLFVHIIDLLEIDVEIIFSSDLNILSNHKVERLVSICKEVGADHYISGPTAKNYIKNEALFYDNGIKLEFQKYYYPPYKQLHGQYTANLSIIDLLFNVGTKEVGNYIWNVNKNTYLP
ncbi:WbqC-like protein family [Candidatus Magnetomorum sp. HK-1]|nr:WbqC-like protein family [Candidatus Magnetomorum sp. HK-1]